ncbi:MAG: hypothetical protein AAGK37_06740 [Pseudomonadota bacterium]
MKLGLIRGSLPRYLPHEHNVWGAAEAAVGALCDAEGASLFVLPDIPMDGRQTLTALDQCRAEGVDYVLLLHGGFTMGDVARTVAASEFRAGFWAVPEPTLSGDIQLNSFVSLNMSLSIARQVRDRAARPVQWYHGAPDSPALQDRLRHTIRAIKAAKSLFGARIGVIGGLAMTFYNMETSTSELRARIGVEVAHHDIHELTGRMAAQDAGRVAAEVVAMGQAAEILGVSETQMALTAQAALSLKDMANEGEYAALAVADWPALQENPGMHPGAAFSWLEETSHIPVAAEGDVLGAVTQLVAKSLTGRVGYLLDMAEPDLESRKLLMWHAGGGPLYLADDDGARWVNHPTITRGDPDPVDVGTISELVFRDGPASVFRITRNAHAVFAMEGNIVAHDQTGYIGCRGWMDGFRMDGTNVSMEDVVSTVMAHGIEHHFVLVPGGIAATLTEFSGWTGMQMLEPKRMRDHLNAPDMT